MKWYEAELTMTLDLQHRVHKFRFNANLCAVKFCSEACNGAKERPQPTCVSRITQPDTYTKIKIVSMGCA
jgi:hypothetical protein